MNEPIDRERASSALAAAVTDVFANMAFLDAERLAAAGPEEGLVTRAAIDVLRPSSCRVELRMRESLRSKISDILYPEGVEGVGEGVPEDALLEILNVIAGNFLTDYFGPGMEIKLELPRYLYLSGDSEGGDVIDLAFDAEGEPLRVVLSSVRYRY
jgi:hypothetical protein